MADSLLTVTIPNLDGLAKDEVRFSFATNTHFADDTAATTFADDFFNHTYAGSGNPMNAALADCLSSVVDASEVRVYDITGHLDGSPHGSPYIIAPWTLQNNGGESRGNQLCAVLGYQTAAYLATPVDGPIGAIPTPESAQDMGAPATHSGTTKLQSRQSGRIYFGPLYSSVVGVDGNNNPELTDTWKTDFSANLHGFLAAHPEWMVWSRRNASLTAIAGGWVDNSIMTRRKKGYTGAGRTLWT